MMHAPQDNTGAPVNQKLANNIVWALDLAERGWCVFPCSPRDKTPLVAKWKEAASNFDPDVRKMFGQFPTAMVGVACGAKSGVWCLDPDAPTDKNPMDGRESWKALQAEQGAAPQTHTHLTPGGGQHVIFAWRGDRAPITNREGALKGKHINVRGEGGYFIAVGSVNADGVAYTMADPALYFQMAPAPDWLHDLIDAKVTETELPGIGQRAVDAMGQRFVNAGTDISTGTGYAKAALVKECAKLAATTIDRNISLNNSAISLGGLWKAGQLAKAEVVAALIAAAVANGLDKEDGRKATLATIKSGMDAAVARVIPLKARNNLAPAPEEPREGGGGGAATNVTEPITIDWAEVDKIRTESKNLASLPADVNATAALILGFKGSRIPDLNIDIARSGVVVDKPFVTWNDVAFNVAQILRCDTRITDEKIAAVLLCPLPCNQIITKEKNTAEKRDIITRLLWRTVEQVVTNKKDEQAEQAKQAAKLAKQAKKEAAEEAKQLAKLPREGEPDWRERRLNGSPMPSMHNARLAINALGIVCSRDLFHNKTLFGFRDGTIKHELHSILGEVTDDGIIALRQFMSDRFGFDLEDKATRDAVRSLAIENCFNPVCDLIDKAEAEWDGVERLDKMAVTHFNCADTPLNRAFLRKTIIAMVARARVPGIKFDTITVLESIEGYNKSTAWRVLAGDENFSDEPIIGKGSREVQEQLSEIWLHENADLAGMKKAEVETVKAFASRTTDIARAAFAHYVVKQLRHSVEVGSTNSEEYLQSQTGNRRFWPLRVLKAIDIAQLKRDRLQLIGEAARRQSAGESITLDEAMWGDAGVQQDKRRIKHPWEAVLAVIHEYHKIPDGSGGYKARKLLHYQDGEERVSSRDLLTYVLEVPTAYQTTAHTMQLSATMKRLGWERTENKITIEKEQVRGFFRKEGVYVTNPDLDEEPSWREGS
jgi:predicted P-loop ATPase